ncbi:hypothetical protein MTO96_046155, partial [Rhipicephalus appendiculatus]
MFGVNCCPPGLLISAAVLLLSWLLLLWKWLREINPPGTRMPPAVPGASLTGHQEMHKVDFYCTTAIKWAKEYGPVYRLRQNLASVLILNDFDSIKKFYSPEGAPESFPVLGLGTMNGDTWKLNRRFCMHTLRDFGMGKSYAMKDIV